jgi:proteasome accessory factor C
MPDTAQAQLQRLVQLIALMSQRDSQGPYPYRAVAADLGVDEPTLRRDLSVLLNLTEAYKPWLASLGVVLDADGFALGSRGPFRRPLRLSRDETLALILGLSAIRGGRELAARLGRTLGAAPDTGPPEDTWAMGPTPAEHLTRVLALARQARDQRRKLELLYCGSRAERSQRTVHPHQVVQAGGAWYIIAWCERARAMRHFRAERVLEAKLLEEEFSRQKGFKAVRAARELLVAHSPLVATVAFSPRIARWLKEQYPDGETAPDGRYLVRWPVADHHWLAREVLQYGAEAEVLEPEGLREFVRSLLG